MGVTEVYVHLKEAHQSDPRPIFPHPLSSVPPHKATRIMMSQMIVRVIDGNHVDG